MLPMSGAQQEEVMADRRASQLLADTLTRRDRAESAMLFGQVRRPQSQRFHFFAFCVERGGEVAKGTAEEISFERIDLSAQKFLDSVDKAEQFLIMMVCHRQSLGIRAIAARDLSNGCCPSATRASRRRN